MAINFSPIYGRHCARGRVFTDQNVVTGKLDPIGDIETIETELMLADLIALQRAFKTENFANRGVIKKL